MIVELCGFPGSGKTTVQRFLMKRLADDGWNVVSGRKLLSEEYPPPVRSKYLKSNDIRRFNFRMAKFRFHNPELMEAVDEISRFEYKEYNLICEMFAIYAAMLELNDPKTCIVLDEGFVHRLSVIFRLYAFKQLKIQDDPKARSASFDTFVHIIELVPQIQASVLLDVPLEVSRTRAYERVLNRRKDVGQEEAKALEKRLTRRYPDLVPLEYQFELYNRALDVLSKKGVKTMTIGSDVAPRQSSARIFDALEK